MSRANVERVRPVRIPVSISRERARARRTLDERLFVRFPGLFRLLVRVVTGLSLQSRLRRLLLTRAVRQGYAAASRRDFDRLLLAFDPRIELHIGVGMVPLDLGPVFHGYDGYRRVWEGLWDVAEDAYLEPHEMLDLGDRLLVAAHMRGHGSGSGAPFDQPFFQAFFLERGLVVKQYDFPTRVEALEAVGLRE